MNPVRIASVRVMPLATETTALCTTLLVNEVAA
jgi:hypothetical protein